MNESSPATVDDIFGGIMEETKLETGRQPFISDEIFPFFVYITHGVMCVIISTIGLCANIMNIATFIKLGFQETINISLMALAVTDFVSLLCLMWMAICYIPSFCDLVCHIIEVHQVQYITGGLPRAYSTVVGGAITSIVAFERCLCVLKPLQVKVIFTKSKLVASIVSAYILIFVPFIPICYTTGLGWVFNQNFNKSLLALTHKPGTYYIDGICFGIMVAMCVITYVAVSICTTLIVWKLASQSAWRTSKFKEIEKSGESDNQQVDAKKGMSGRDKRATNTVIIIATLYIVCFFPGAAIQLAMSFIPDFNKGGFYERTFSVSWALAYVVEGIGSSANILVYLKTSTKFREAFLGFFRKTIN